MLKKIFIVFIGSFLHLSINAQLLYSERFNSLTLTTITYTTSSGVESYGFNDVPTSLFSINNGDKIADTLSANYPFKSAGQKLKAWLSYTKPELNDTFAVSTSWLKPTGTADAWLITPLINNITANSVLSWEAMAPDAINKDGYEVYVVSSTNALPLVSEFADANRLYTNTGENTTWTKRGLSLANFAGQSIKIAFRNNSNNKYQLWLDDIVVENITNQYDVTAEATNYYKYSTVNTTNFFTVDLRNLGSAVVGSFVLNYKAGDNAVVSEQKNVASPINYLEKITVPFPTPFITSVAGYYPVKIWASALNNQSDQNSSNDTLLLPLTILASVPEKKVLIENYTSTKCGNCADVQNHLEYAALTTYSNAIFASLHNEDSLLNKYTNALINDYQLSYGQFSIDQYAFALNNNKLGLTSLSNNTFASQRQNMVVPASVSVTAVSYNAATREISATVSSTFYGDVNSDYRLNLYIKENNVYGPIGDNSDNGWNQYNTSYIIPTSPYYQTGNFLSSDTYILQPNQYKHQFVIHELLDGAYGVAGIIPNTPITNAQTYSKTYSYTLPTNTLADAFVFNPENIYLIGVVSEFDNEPLKRAIINAAEVKLISGAELPVSVKAFDAIPTEFSVYPNPATHRCVIKYQSLKPQWNTVSIYNTLGELVFIQTHQANMGEQLHELTISDLASGTYYVKINCNSTILTQPLIIIK